MKIGISICSSYAVDDPRQGARNMIERARAACEAELDSLFIGDHHVTPQPYYQNSPMLGRLLAEWDPARPAGALYLLPLWNPVLLAEQVATLASIHGGRFILQCGLGHGENTFRAMGVDHRFRPSMFEESLTALRALWSGEKINLDHRYHQKGAHISPLPPEPIDIWIGATAQAAIERTGRLGDGWLASPGLTPQTAAAAIEAYGSACSAAGRTRGTCAIRRDVFVGRDAAQAAAVAEPYVQGGYRGFDPAALVCGDIDQVTASFRQLEALGFTEVIVRNLVSDQSLALATIERLGVVRTNLA